MPPTTTTRRCARRFVYEHSNSPLSKPAGRAALFVAKTDGSGDQRSAPWTIAAGDTPDWSLVVREMLLRVAHVVWPWLPQRSPLNERAHSGCRAAPPADRGQRAEGAGPSRRRACSQDDPYAPGAEGRRRFETDRIGVSA